MLLFIWYLIKAIIIALFLWGAMVVLIRKLYNNFAFEALHLIICVVVAVLTVVLSVFISVTYKTKTVIQAGVELAGTSMMGNRIFVNQLTQLTAGIGETISEAQAKDVVSLFKSQVSSDNILVEHVENMQNTSSLQGVWEKIHRADTAERPQLFIDLLINQYVALVLGTISRVYWGLIIALIFFQGALLMFLLGQAKKRERVNRAFKNFDF